MEKLINFKKSNFILNISYSNLIFLLIFLFGIFSSYVFLKGIYYDVLLSNAIIFFSSLGIYILFLKKQVGILTLCFWFFLALPYIHFIPYIWFQYDIENPKYMWSAYANHYMKDKIVIEALAMVASIAALGVLSGMMLCKTIFKINKDKLNIIEDFKQPENLTTVIWTIWLMVAFIFFWMSSPPDSIFVKAYSAGGNLSISHDVNLSSSWFIALSILSFTYCDFKFDKNLSRRKFKSNTFIFGTFLIIVYFGLLRGDREALTFILGLLLFEVFWFPGQIKGEFPKIPWFKILILLLLILVISKLFLLFRYNAVGISFSTFIEILKGLNQLGDYNAGFEVVSFSNLVSGTWSYSLLSAIGVIGDYVYGISNFSKDKQINTTKFFLYYGSDYVNMILSTPPGIIADLMGYQRPWHIFYSPAWDIPYGQGGWNFLVLPFRNFLTFGVFFFAFLCSLLINLVECKCFTHKKNYNSALVLIILIALPHWLWYGEKQIINAIILWFVLYFLYKLSLNFIFLIRK